MSQTAVFSFGYWGCGGATRGLIEAIDAAEDCRGFGPPLWVDIRIQRSVRAAGFRDDRFENLLKDRYVWMRGLGNVHIQERRAGIKIKDPAVARELLELSLRARNRRVIFFCACRYPSDCHRLQVGKLLMEAAQQQGSAITVAEWPGGNAQTRVIAVSLATFRRIERGQLKSIPLPQSLSLAEAACIPWGTVATFRAESAMPIARLVGPARFNAGGPYLQVFSDEPGTRAGSQAFRNRLCLAELSPAI